MLTSFLEMYLQSLIFTQHISNPHLKKLTSYIINLTKGMYDVQISLLMNVVSVKNLKFEEKFLNIYGFFNNVIFHISKKI